MGIRKSERNREEEKDGVLMSANRATVTEVR